MRLNYDFEWSRCIDGHEIREDQIFPNSERFEKFHPFADKDEAEVLQKFINQSGPNDLLLFANEFGLLFTRGEIIAGGFGSLGEMRRARIKTDFITGFVEGARLHLRTKTLDFYNAQAPKDQQDELEQRRKNLEKIIDFVMDEYGVSGLSFEVDELSLPVTVTPKNLFSALWLELDNALEKGLLFFSCHECGTFYRPKRKPRRNVVNNFCSRPCSHNFTMKEIRNRKRKEK